MGTLTINTTGAQDAIIVAAVGGMLGLGRNATAAEVKAMVIRDFKAKIEGYDLAIKQQQVAGSTIDPS